LQAKRAEAQLAEEKKKADLQAKRADAQEKRAKYLQMQLEVTLHQEDIRKGLEKVINFITFHRIGQTCLWRTQLRNYFNHGNLYSHRIIRRPNSIHF